MPRLAPVRIIVRRGWLEVGIRVFSGFPDFVTAEESAFVTPSFRGDAVESNYGAQLRT